MAEPFVAEISMVAFNFAPIGWAFCNGQLLPISQNTALFSLLGVNYGGNGLSTFGLPNLQGKVAMNSGSGQGLSPRVLGESGGEAQVTLSASEIPAHTHTTTTGAGAAANSATPVGAFPATPASGTPYADTGDTLMAGDSLLGSAGGSQPHNNYMPSLAVNFVIALQGVFPSRP